MRSGDVRLGEAEETAIAPAQHVARARHVHEPGCAPRVVHRIEDRALRGRREQLAERRARRVKRLLGIVRAAPQSPDYAAHQPGPEAGGQRLACAPRAGGVDAERGRARDVAGRPGARDREVDAAGAEALRAEAVGYTVLRQALERGAQRLGRAGLVRALEAEPEAVSAQVAEAELVAVTRDFEHLEAGHVELRERGFVAELHAEPLPRDRDPVLPARVADLALRAARRTGERVDHVVGVQLALLDVNVEVLARAAGLVGGQLVDREVGGAGAKSHRAHGSATDPSEGRPERGRKRRRRAQRAAGERSQME